MTRDYAESTSQETMKHEVGVKVRAQATVGLRIDCNEMCIAAHVVLPIMVIVSRMAIICKREGICRSECLSPGQVRMAL